MASDSDIISNFSPLDELVQVIYQGAWKFVILSAVDNVAWTVHVGLNGRDGRWWRGSWTEKDILEIVGPKLSTIRLESFAERLAETFVQGELFVGNWSSEPGADINLSLGNSEKKPMVIPLHELSAAEAAAHATKVFSEIALQAQSRKCRLHPSQFVASTIASPLAAKYRKGDALSTSHGAGPSKKRPITDISDPAKDAGDEITALKAELAIARKKNQLPLAQANLVSRAASSAPRAAHKGASLANPNKKARKYQAIEFESDED